MSDEPNDFRIWMQQMGFNGKQVSVAGELIGLRSKRVIQGVASNERGLTETERLAMAARQAGLAPWTPDSAKQIEAVRRVVALVQDLPRLSEDTNAK